MTTAQPGFHGLDIFGLDLHFAGGGRGSGFAGAAWRGLLGQALCAAVCPYPTPACAACPTVGSCAYPDLFKPVDAARLPPFWLHDWQRGREGWRVGLRWVGDKSLALGEWLAALAQDAPHLSFSGTRARLTHAISAADSSLTWQAGSGWRTPLRPLVLLPSSQPPRTCRIAFRAPLVSKHGGDPLYGALHTRLQRLVALYGDGCELPRSDLPWDCRVLDRKERRIPLAKRMLSGIEWQLELTAIDPAAWSLLQAGAELHAGGQTGMGCGRYALV